MCEAPFIDNGSFSPEQVLYEVGDTVEFECDPGYTLHGPVKVTCGNNALWSKRFPICIRKFEICCVFQLSCCIFSQCSSHDAIYFLYCLGRRQVEHLGFTANPIKYETSAGQVKKKSCIRLQRVVNVR